jgi:hypothetical protein
MMPAASIHIAGHVASKAWSPEVSHNSIPEGSEEAYADEGVTSVIRTPTVGFNTGDVADATTESVRPDKKLTIGVLWLRDGPTTKTLSGAAIVQRL